MNRSIFAILALLGSLVTANAATLLPNGKQTFIDQNGAPLAGGTVTFYIPGTTTLKTTWQDSAQTIANTNPVTLGIDGTAIIYGSGCYRQIVKGSTGNTIWDQPTCDISSTSLIWGGHSSGTANSQTVTASNFSSADGQTIQFVAGLTNTGPLSLIVNGASPIAVLRDTTTGPVSLSGGEAVLGNAVGVVYDATRGAFHLISNPVTGANPLSTLSASGTTDLGLASSRFINVTGTATVTSFGSTASPSFPLYTLSFGTGAVTLTNSASLLLPGGANIVSGSGDFAVAAYLGSGNWRVLTYARASGGTVIPVPVFQRILSCPWAPPTSGGNLPLRVEYEIVGGGGGGGGNATDGGAGGNTTFAGITANGGSPGVHSINNFGVDGGAGGTGGAGSAELRLDGQSGGGSGSNEGAGGVGAAGLVAGSGGRAAASWSYGGAFSPSGTAGRQNGGLGGGGGGFPGTVSLGGSGGGGGGEYARGTATTITASMACTLGAGGTAGTSGGTGGAGAIMTRSYWQ